MKSEQRQLCIAMCLALSLVNLKETPLYHKYKHYLSAYTNWNLIFLSYRYIFSMQSWDPFLCINSVGIFVGFHTAFANGLDKNLWNKLRYEGLQLTNFQMSIGDHIVHTLPALLTTAKLLSNSTKIPFITILYTLTFGSLFSYSQCGKLDSSESYVPHPWKRAWLSILLSMIMTQKAVNHCVDKKYSKAILSATPLALPYILSKFDKKMKKKYTFEYLVQRHRHLPRRCIRKIRSVATF